MPGRVDPGPFEQFRAGLLRHIGMEEKILLPAVRRAQGAALPVAKLLRAEHGALAALLVPTPTPEVVARIREVLAPHNDREEGAGGLYEDCDRLLGAEAEAVLAQLRGFPAVPLAPHNDGALVEKHIAETMERARKAGGRE